MVSNDSYCDNWIWFWPLAFILLLTLIVTLPIYMNFSFRSSSGPFYCRLSWVIAFLLIGVWIPPMAWELDQLSQDFQFWSLLYSPDTSLDTKIGQLVVSYILFSYAPFNIKLPILAWKLLWNVNIKRRVGQEIPLYIS